MPELIGVAGGTSSGKSTVCAELASRYCFITHVRTDIFFKEEKDVAKICGFPNYETPESMRLEELYRALEELRDGKTVNVPAFKKVARKIEYVETIEPRALVLVDGFMLFCDEKLKNMFDLKLFFDAPAEQRLQRRVDRHEREKRPFDIAYWNLVEEGFAKYGDKKQYADHVIDASGSIEKATADTEAILKRHYGKFFL